MKQEKFTSFILIGSGRVARHLQHYFRFLRLPFASYSRDGDPEFNSWKGASLADAAARGSHLLFAISDPAIEEVSRPFWGTGKTLVHFSGGLEFTSVRAAHPLMTFGPRLEEEAWYRRIPFVIDRGSSLADLLPGLPNAGWELDPAHRPLYHALCALAGNASYLAWSQIGAQFESRLNLPRGLLAEYLRQTVTNALRDQDAAGFTGPVARGDWRMVERHLCALDGEPALRLAYEDYLDLARRAGVAVPEDLL
jgi:predicted short-subunit dehydrogenase-like oxidoreductase (DUF2520 family)